MSEIKTYRCNVCHKTYHSDEPNMEVLVAIKPKDGEEVQSYDHICPKCGGNIYELMRYPRMLDRLEDEKNAAYGKNVKLERMIKSQRDKICGYKVWPLNSSVNYDCEYYKDMIEEVNSKYESTHKSRDIWRHVGITFITAWVIRLLLTILQHPL